MRRLHLPKFIRPFRFTSKRSAVSKHKTSARLSFGNLIRKALFAFLALTVVPVAMLRWWPPCTSAFMLEAQALAWWRGTNRFELNYHWSDWERISPYAAIAVVAAEDQLFARHFGFDFRAIAKAVEHNQGGRRLRGASTISQQTAKNLFLYPKRNYLRKGLESYFTVLIESLWSKRRILEVYLNIAQFGEGIYGVEAASNRFFHKPARRLEPREAALLAAVLPNPIKLRVDRPSPYVRKRQAWILRQMRQLGGAGYLQDM